MVAHHDSQANQSDLLVENGHLQEKSCARVVHRLILETLHRENTWHIYIYDICATRYLSMYMILQMSLNTKAAKNSPVDLPKPKKNPGSQFPSCFFHAGCDKGWAWLLRFILRCEKDSAALDLGNSLNHAGFLSRGKNWGMNQLTGSSHEIQRYQPEQDKEPDVW